MRLPSRWAGALTRGWRMLALVCAAWLLHHTAVLPRKTALSLADALPFFPEAARLSSGKAQSLVVEDASGASLGLLVTTSPEADGVVGYAGPSNLLVALDNGMRLAGLRVLESADTPAHVERLSSAEAFERSLLGWKPAVEPPPRIDGIAGSTLTGLAMVESVARRMGGNTTSLRFPEPLSLSEVAALFPSAKKFDVDASKPGWFRVESDANQLLGFVVRTSPSADGVLGYAGPTECLISVAPDRDAVREIRIRRSYDTDEYVHRVREDGDYLKSLTRWSVREWPRLSFDAEKVEGVAGATATSYGVAEAVRKKLAADFDPQAAPQAFLQFGSMCGTLLFISGALALSFSPLRGRRWIRIAWQAALIAGLGLWLGQLLSTGVLIGWARHGVPWKHAAGLAALAAVALVVPLLSGRQVYCHHLCPHGATQEWLGRIPLPKLRIPPGWDRALRCLPGLLFLSVFFTALRRPGFSAAAWEPFDAWGLGLLAWGSAIIASVGLLAACFVPMAHCKYGCITGELLRWMRCDSAGNVLGRRDLFVAVCLLSAWALSRGSTSNGESIPRAEAGEIRGTGFGTTWCVKARSDSGSLYRLRGRVVAEINRIERTLSHWSPDSATSSFNASRTVDFQQVPSELASLVAFTRDLSHATAGAYDITVGPLVGLWGFGPRRGSGSIPTDAQVQQALLRVGWERVCLAADVGSLRKTHPMVELDLGSVLQGYAVDQVCGLLSEVGVPEYLVEIGGELRARGAWNVAIEDPLRSGASLTTLCIKDSALATSGVSRSGGHILSPITGHPVENGLLQMSVHARTCLEADGWATALFASGWEHAERIATERGLSLWALKKDHSLARADNASRLTDPAKSR